ncbi:MAG: hypothetical protein E2591_26700 [Achromobacter sp.]|uniref:hypothetical protein n=1 Tax=Achromobacter sp. TaxID=134375 RepID=UPI0012BEE9CF|nr:hypothetical protein [Achromobacter sp.]MPS81668.1 hypothetical protein [Achromobacter sp.]
MTSNASHNSNVRDAGAVPDNQAIMAEVDAFARRHLTQLAVEIIELQDSGLLPHGLLPEVSAMARPICGESTLKVVQASICRVALERIVQIKRDPA